MLPAGCRRCAGHEPRRRACYLQDVAGARVMSPEDERVTCRMSPVRGSRMRTFLSLQETTKRLPSQFHDAHSGMSGRLSISMSASDVPTFQMKILLSEPAHITPPSTHVCTVRTTRITMYTYQSSPEKQFNR